MNIWEHVSVSVRGPLYMRYKEIKELYEKRVKKSFFPANIVLCDLCETSPSFMLNYLS